jgi:hypothetical protein
MGDPTWCDPQAAGWWLWGICSWIGGGWCNGSGPWITDDTGRLVKQSGTGVSRQRPHLGDNGRGVNHAGLREPGVWRQRPHLSNNGMGVNHPQLREPGTDDGEEFHPVTMPELRRWFAYLSARLRHVRILNGDFARCLTGGAAKTLPVRQGKGPCGVFLDPPYSHEVRDASLYTVESADAAVRAREWALAHGDDKQYRIVFAGFEGEHGDAFTDAGWTEHEWFAEGWLQGGMARTSKKDTHQQKRERLYASPHCWKQRDLFGGPT